VTTEILLTIKKMQKQTENVSEQMKNSIFAYNGDFSEYQREFDGAVSPPLQRSLSTHDYLLLQWNGAVDHLQLYCSSLQEENKTFFKDWFYQLWNLHTMYAVRHYHTVVHLEEMCYYLQFIFETLVMKEKSTMRTDRAKSILLLAIFFHDAIYDPQSNKNEEESASLFETFANDINMHPHEKHDVVAYILATKHHTVDDDIVKSMLPGAIIDYPLLLFLDLDMAVLGKDEQSYKQYAALIRREYDFVPLSTYCAKRAEILEAFLQQKQIFYTPVFHSAFECRARRNIQHEILCLRKGNIPW
jgi:predicted metal-dependent HD superfamily phosphohydrolase